MASPGNLVDVETKRRELESNVSKLRASLRHWQQWEIEYEGMREELEDLGQRYSRKDLKRLEDEDESSLFKVDGTDLSGNLLNTKERRLLIYDDKGKPRSVQAIIGLLSRRVDYVERSIKSVVALLTSAEQNLAALNASSTADIGTEDASPITEIQEELDDKGNVLSSKTTHPGETAADVLQTFQQGLSEDTVENEETAQSSLQPLTPPLISRAGVEHDAEDDQSAAASPSRPRSRSDSKKRVSFAADTKPEHDTSEHPNQLPKEEQTRLLQSACSQLRQQLGKNVAVHKIDTLNRVVPNVSLVRGTDADIASQILRMRQNREAKRLLKAEDLDMKGAADVLCRMAELSIYDVESPQLSATVSHARDTRSVASSSRESSPGVLSDAYPGDTPNTSLSSSPLGSTRDHTQLMGPGSDDAIFEESKESDPENYLRGDDTPEEAAVRRQMLQYSMSEVGAVVAELNLEEDDEADDIDEIDIETDSDDKTVDEDEDEDEHGRTITQVVNGDYLAEMRALEAKLNARAMINTGPEKTDNNHEDNSKPKEVTQRKPSSPKRTGSAKGVRFAEELDIQEAPSDFPLQEQPLLERKRSLAPEASDTPKTKKPSRFKAARTNHDAKLERKNDENAAPKAPSTNKDAPLGSRPIVEREISSTMQPSGPSDMEPAFLQQEVRNEYHRLRNRLISQQGGFSAHNELDDNENDDDSDEEYEAPENGKKLSRFRAARLGVK